MSSSMSGIIWFYLFLLFTLQRIEVRTAYVRCKPPIGCSESGEVCCYDEKEGCIRKYASKCHLEMAACLHGEIYSDYSNIYCSMETYLCEKDYERWTIFFGHEKDIEEVGEQ